jgi:hypothetical protein
MRYSTIERRRKDTGRREIKARMRPLMLSTSLPRELLLLQFNSRSKIKAFVFIYTSRISYQSKPAASTQSFVSLSFVATWCLILCATWTLLALLRQSNDIRFFDKLVD